jgi:Tol biopolymer transport system component
MPNVSPIIPPTKPSLITAQPALPINTTSSAIKPANPTPIENRASGSSEDSQGFGQIQPTLLANAQMGYLQAGDLWVSDERGGNRRQLTQSGTITADKVYWSPLRDKVAVMDLRDGLALFDLAGRKLSLYRPDPLSQTLNIAAWSPDGRYLAFDMIVANRPSNGNLPQSLATDGEIYLIDTQLPVANSPRLDGTSQQIPPQRLASGFGFAWSPDGRQLAYATHARRLEVVEYVPLQSSATTSPTGATTKSSLPVGTPGVTTTPVKSISQVNATPFPIIKPQRSATPETRTSPTANPYYNAPRMLVPYDNALAIMSIADRRENILFYSNQLPPYPANDGAAYPTGGSAVQYINWSSDGRNLTFADKFSYVGVASVAGGIPRMLYGQPRGFALEKTLWLTGANNALLLIWQNIPGEERELVGVLTAPGVIGSAISDKMNCAALSPTGQQLAYWDSNDTMIIKLDGSTLGTVAGGSCPAWSADGSFIATSRRGSDGSVVVVSPTGQIMRQFLGTRAVEQVFWFAPN